MQLFVWNDTMREKIPVKVVPATDVDFGLTQKWQSQWTTLAAQGMPNKVALHRCDDNELLGLISYQINEKGMAVEVVYVESAGHSNANLLKQTGGKKKIYWYCQGPLCLCRDDLSRRWLWWSVVFPSKNHGTSIILYESLWSSSFGTV